MTGQEGTVSCLDSPALHSSTDRAFTTELALQACRSPSVTAVLPRQKCQEGTTYCAGLLPCNGTP